MGLPQLLDEGASLLMLIFDYRHEASCPWPGSVSDACRLTAYLPRQPFHLAVYSSDDFFAETQELLAQLAWEMA